MRFPSFSWDFWVAGYAFAALSGPWYVSGHDQQRQLVSCAPLPPAEALFRLGDHAFVGPGHHAGRWRAHCGDVRHEGFRD